MTFSSAFAHAFFIKESLMLEAIGRVIIILSMAFVVLILLALLFCSFTLRTKKIILPNFILSIITLLYEPLRRLLSFFRVDPSLIDRVSVEIRNALDYPDFAATSMEERVLLLPQCIRSTECPAKLNPVDGIHCVECGKCVIAELSAICKELGIRMYISPGGTFTARILIHSRPKAKAVVGVACYPNLHEGMLNAKLLGVAAQGVPLTTPGCVNTSVDHEEIINKLLSNNVGNRQANSRSLFPYLAIHYFPILLIPASAYVLVGEIFIIFVIAVAALILTAICLAIYKRDLFPRFTLFVLNLFYQPSKLFLGYFHINPVIVDEIGIALMNSVYKDAYRKTPMDKRLLFLPQCLRNLECPAKTSPREGIICEGCGRCGIAELKKLCDEHGINICIAPGGEFVKRAVRDKKPQAAMGVACQHDLYEGMRGVSSKGIPVVGVVLSKTGCVMTEVDWEDVKRNIVLGQDYPA